MKGIYLLLGSNLGDSLAMLNKAKDLIASEIGQVINLSSIYSTKAWGVEDQADFLNQVLEVDSVLSPVEFLTRANEIEKKLGRVRHVKWHSRIIDIDILYFGSEIIKTEKLTIPHPENENRSFVLVPMAEIAPEFIHPELRLSQQQLLDKCRDGLGVVKMNN